MNGSSEYDGECYTAKSEIKTIFETALFDQIRPIASGNDESAQAVVAPPQPINPIDQTSYSPSLAKPQLIISVAVTASVAMILVFAYWRRKVSTH